MADLFTKTKVIAPFLKGVWRYHHLEERNSAGYGDRAVLLCAAHPEIHITIRPCWNKAERFRIGGSFPYGRFDKTITVSAERPAEAIAADIARRLVPDLLADSAIKRMEQEQRTRELEAYKVKIDLVRSIVPDMRKIYRQDLTGYDDQFCMSDGKIRTSKHSARLEITLPYDTLIKVLMLVYGEGRRPE